jgi:hypothetical protein
MERHNKATETMIDLVCRDLERYDTAVDERLRYDRYSENSSYSGSLPLVEFFKQEVLWDHGLTDDSIEMMFANGYDTDALYTVAVQAFMKQVNWEQVLIKYEKCASSVTFQCQECDHEWDDVPNTIGHAWETCPNCGADDTENFS